MDDLLRAHRVNGNKSVGHDERRWKLHLEPVFAAVRASQVSTDTLRRYVERRQTAKASNATINRELALLRSAFHLALKSSPARVARVPHFPILPENNVRTGFLKDEDHAKLADECGKERLWLRALLEVYVSYGWRKNEALQLLRVKQIDLPNRTIRLYDSKNGEGRLVAMTNKVYELLSACVEGKAEDDFVFTRPNGKPVKDFRKRWASVCERAGVPGLYIHDLRRTAARNLRRLGVDESTTMKIGGWKTPSMFRRYNIVDEADLVDAAAKLDAKAAKSLEEKQQREAPPDPGTETTPVVVN